MRVILTKKLFLCSVYTRRKETLGSLRMLSLLLFITAQLPHFTKRWVQELFYIIAFKQRSVSRKFQIKIWRIEKALSPEPVHCVPLYFSKPNLEWKQNSFAGPLSETFEKQAPGPHYYFYRMHVSPPSGRLGTNRGEICRGSGTKYHHQCQTPCRPLVAQGPLTKKVRPGVLLMRACSHAILIITPLFRNATCRSTDNFVHCWF